MTSRWSAARIASLGELYRQLGGAGVRVPNGFAITAEAYRHFITASGLAAPMALTTGCSPDLADLAGRGLAIRQAIVAAALFRRSAGGDRAAYDTLGDGQPVDVAVRTSATAEDLPDASFAGQQETFLNVRGHAALLDACRRIVSLAVHRPRDLLPRRQGVRPRAGRAVVGVQQMVRSDLATSGVMFTLDTETRLPRRRADQRLVRARRDRRAGVA